MDQFHVDMRTAAGFFHLNIIHYCLVLHTKRTFLLNKTQNTDKILYASYHGGGGGGGGGRSTTYATEKEQFIHLLNWIGGHVHVTQRCGKEIRMNSLHGKCMFSVQNNSDKTPLVGETNSRSFH